MADTVDRLHGGQCRRRISRDRHGQRVEDKIFFIDAIIRGSLNDLLRNRDSFFGRIRDTALIESQRNDESAILGNEWEDHAHDLFFTVDRVDHGLTVIGAKSCFHGNRIGRIELKRKIRNRLQFSYRTKQKCRLVDLGKTDVNVEELHSRILLFQGFT